MKENSAELTLCSRSYNFRAEQGLEIRCPDSQPHILLTTPCFLVLEKGISFIVATITVQATDYPLFSL